MCGQFFGPLGPLGGDDDPFLGKKVLAKLGHVSPSRFSYRQMEGFLQRAHRTRGAEVVLLSLLADSRARIRS